MSRVLFLLSSCLLFAPVVAQAQTPQEEVIVTARRGPDGAPAALYGGAFSSLEAEDLDLRQARIVSDALRAVPSLAVSRLGGPGGLTQLRIRGAEANHTLVLIDGIEASDPFQGEFDFAGLIAEDGARIEILRGAQSALYGSDAIAGVIHYLTPSGREAPGGQARIEAGSFGSHAEAVRFGGAFGDFDIALSGASAETDGTNIARVGVEDDGARSRVASAKLGYRVGGSLTLRAVGRYAQTRADTDPQDFASGLVVDAADDRFRLQTRAGLIGATLALAGGRWRHDVSAQALQAERRTAPEGGFADSLDGGREKVSYVSSLDWSTGATEHAATLAVDWERERYRNNATLFAPGPANEERTLTTRGYAAQYGIVVADRVSLNAAARFDDNSRFKDATTYRMEAALAPAPGAKLSAAYGVGVKNPTNFELFGFDPTSFVGDPNLEPERAEGFEVAVSQQLFDGRARLSATYFDARLEDEIATRFDANFVAFPVNLDTRSTRRGVELEARATLLDGLTLDAFYAFLDAQEDGREEIRRPPHSGSATLSWRDARGASLFFAARYVGETEDDDFSTFPATRVTLGSYTLVDLGGETAVFGGAALFARIENALDEDYEGAFSYASPGRAGYLGLKARF